MEPKGSSPIVLLLAEGEAGSGFLQRLAGGWVWCDRPLAADAASAHRPPRPLPPRDRFWTPIYDGPGLLAGGLERIRVARGDQGGYSVTHEDGGTFLVAADGGTIRLRAIGSHDIVSSDIFRALGAPLALALALRGVYLLHASGLARRDGSVIGFTAASGGGKSTLAAAAAASPELGLVRVADDQLPVRLGASPTALPHFPQLKLPPTDRYPAVAAPVVALGAFVELDVDPTCVLPEWTRLAPSAALQALVRATVAAKLFDRELLTRHFDACAATARDLPAYRMRTPRDIGRLAETLAIVSRLAE